MRVTLCLNCLLSVVVAVAAAEPPLPVVVTDSSFAFAAAAGDDEPLAPPSGWIRTRTSSESCRVTVAAVVGSGDAGGSGATPALFVSLWLLSLLSVCTVGALVSGGGQRGGVCGGLCEAADDRFAAGTGRGDAFGAAFTADEAAGAVPVPAGAADADGATAGEAVAAAAG